jgi:8-oxo-dGTP pyrophosphatase MutT (NUDIX family)
MKTVWKIIGRIGGYLSWPLVAVIIRFTTRTKVLIVCGDEVLLLQGWLGTGSWSLPGGGIRVREKPELAALREIKEETGIVVKNTELLSLGEFRQTQGHHYSFRGYLVQLRQKPPLTLRVTEITDADWVKLDEINKLPEHQHIQLLLDAWRKQR